MPIDFKSLHKLESVPGSLSSRTRSANEIVQVLVKLRKGAKRPSFIKPRAQITSRIFSADVTFGDMQRLEADPAVESMALARRMPGIK
ncbi:hypothetical protein QA640_09820 [Bradyrhizobium sp. CB82]|uniref:hypothetical protein n=1 Tax=Bradyrhizobium sp. CB82 TaxID=3039159 RepID=UPI0024B27E1F|nr:hypothetical protein [Bradyrhizobium sp. CB82]WFU42725.1 hypothetical protein QA640_09820 [Bradyrhizobium sp. CB82]